MRKKPKFYRRCWNKVIRMGKTTKKKRKWRRAYGRDSKVRLKERGYAKSPGIGYGNIKKEKGKISGFKFVKIENIKEMEKIKEGAIIIGSVGKKKRQEIIKKAEGLGLKILNKYKSRKSVERKNATG